jgi:hypothetical protein
MRSRWLFFGCLAMLSLLAPAAKANDLGVWHEITLHAPVPCSFACPYWLDDLNSDIDGNEKEDVYFQACASPDGTSDALQSVPGLPYAKGTVYDEVLLGPTPDDARLLAVELRPVVDYDGFICDPETGEELAATTSAFQCSSPVPVDYLPMGCVEDGSIEAIPGESYILRVYNWSDWAPVPVRYRYLGGGW